MVRRIGVAAVRRDHVVQTRGGGLDVVLQMYWRTEQVDVDRFDPPGQRGGVAAESRGETTGPESSTDDGAVPLIVVRNTRSTTPCTSVFGSENP